MFYTNCSLKKYSLGKTEWNKNGSTESESSREHLLILGMQMLQGARAKHWRIILITTNGLITKGQY